MKVATYILFLFCISGSHLRAQVLQDFRARITPNAQIQRISVLDDESIWLGTMAGELYYTEHFEKSWHYALREASVSGSPQFNTVVGLNNGVMLVAGQMTVGTGYGPNAVLRSTDRGKTWTTIPFTTNEEFLQVHTVDYNQNGEVWLSGGPARFFYSNDFGKTWTAFTTPYAPPMRVYGMDMTTGGVGYISTHDGKIAQTKDNGKSWTSVSTPYDQKLFTPTEIHWTLLQVDKISATNNHLIARQGDIVYFTNRDTIQWNAFADTLIDFSVDRTTQQLVGFSRSGRVIFYDEQLQSISSTMIGDMQFEDVQAVKGKLYGIDHGNNVYRISAGKVEKINLFTEDYPIQTPAVVQKGTALKWGIDGRDIYNTSFNSSNWYRIKSVDFAIVDFRLLNDNEAILWDGKTSHYYNRDKDSLAVFVESKPLSQFLSSKIDRIEISTTTRGCFHFESAAIVYERQDEKFVCTSEKRKADEKLEDTGEGKRFSADEIVNALTDLNDDPSRSFDISELVTDELIKNSTMTKLRRAWNEKESYSRKKKKPFVEAHFQQLIQSADSLSENTIRKLILTGSGGWSTTSNVLQIKFTNATGNTLTMLGVGYSHSMPFFLPWSADVDETNFSVTSLRLARAVEKLMPNWMLFKGQFKEDELLFSLIKTIDGF